MIGPRVAVYGGTFDPPHIAHVLVTAWARAMGEVDRVLVIPTFSHPLGKAPGADYAHRYAMCVRATATLRDVEVDRIEETLGGTSRTLDTLAALRAREPGASFRLVIGADILDEVHRWHRWDEVASIAPPLVVGRVGYPARGLGRLVEMPNVSSTEIREALERGDDSVRTWLPADVAEYIAEHRLYRSRDERAS